jgi:hypothetical protein
MGFALFDSSNLAVLAYASVKTDGTLIASNNMTLSPGYAPGSGNYTFLAPQNLDGGLEPIFSATDICIVTVLDADNVSLSVTNLSEVAKSVNFRDTQTGFPVNPDFTIVIMRTLVTPP